MRQLMFQFIEEKVLCFQCNVKRELIREMVKAIIRVNEKEGGNNGNPKDKS